MEPKAKTLLCMRVISFIADQRHTQIGQLAPDLMGAARFQLDEEQAGVFCLVESSVPCACGALFPFGKDRRFQTSLGWCPIFYKSEIEFSNPAAHKLFAEKSESFLAFAQEDGPGGTSIQTVYRSNSKSGSFLPKSCLHCFLQIRFSSLPGMNRHAARLTGDQAMRRFQEDLHLTLLKEPLHALALGE